MSPQFATIRRPEVSRNGQIARIAASARHLVPRPTRRDDVCSRPPRVVPDFQFNREFRLTSAIPNRFRLSSGRRHSRVTSANFRREELFSNDPSFARTEEREHARRRNGGMGGEEEASPY